MLQSLVERSSASEGCGEHGPNDAPEGVTNRVLAIMFATFDTTALTLANALMDLINVQHLDIASSLKEEITGVTARSENGSTMNMLTHLRLMDRRV
jgi:hypothetical protein